MFRGIINAFGAYQDYYETSSLLSETPSTISWIGTIQGFILALAGSITGPIYDRGYFRHLIFTGTFLVTLGTMMTSLCSSYYQLVLAQGICVGLGAACFWVPSAAILATYFDSKRNLMMAIAVAGSAIGDCRIHLSGKLLLTTSIGSIIYPIVFRRLQPTIGFGWATRVIGLTALVLCSISCAVMKPRVQPPTRPRALIDWSAFREGPFVLMSLGMFFSYTGVYIPFFYTPIYGSRMTGLDDKVSFYLLPVISASSIFGRVIPGLIADKAGPLNVLIPLGTVTAALTFAWLVITDAPGLWIFCGLYGFFSGAFIFLPPTIIAGLTPDLTCVGTRLGMSFTFAGFGLLIGNPIAGTMVNIPDGEFHGAQLFSAATITTGVAMFILAWVLIIRARKVLKASLGTPSQASETAIVPV